jgi:hypothetical protein
MSHLRASPDNVPLSEQINQEYLLLLLTQIKEQLPDPGEL